MKPAAFTPDLKTTLWVMADVVCVLTYEHAKVVFQHTLGNIGLTVYGIKGMTANVLTNLDQARDFFGESA